MAALQHQSWTQAFLKKIVSWMMWRIPCIVIVFVVLVLRSFSFSWNLTMDSNPKPGPVIQLQRKPRVLRYSPASATYRPLRIPDLAKIYGDPLYDDYPRPANITHNCMIPRSTDDGYTIPNVIHVAFAMSPDFGEKKFNLLHFMSVLSSYKFNKPHTIVMHYIYDNLEYNEHWEKASEYFTLCKWNEFDSIFGQPVNHVAHKADVIRLLALFAVGGMYHDIDVLIFRAFTPFRNSSKTFVINEEWNNVWFMLGNSVMMSAPKSEFIQRWLRHYDYFNDSDWNYHSIILPGELAKNFSDLVWVIEPDRYLTPSWQFWKQTWEHTDNKSYWCGHFGVHVWESKCYEMFEKFTEKDFVEHDSPIGQASRKIFYDQFMCPQENF